VPAPAVIPAPVAYIKVAAVKKLVVEILSGRLDSLSVSTSSGISLQSFSRLSLDGIGSRRFTLRKLECSRQASARIH
jgi:hypothetical protein